MGCFSASQTTNEQVIPVERTMQTKTNAYIDTLKKKTYTAIYVLEMVVPNGTLHISTIKKLTIHNFVLKACHKASAAIRWVVAQLQQTHTSLGTFRSSGWTRGELGVNSGGTFQGLTQSIDPPIPKTGARGIFCWWINNSIGIYGDIQLMVESWQRLIVYPRAGKTNSSHGCRRNWMHNAKPKLSAHSATKICLQETLSPLVNEEFI